MLNGILVIDKDKGMTSADVVYHLRKALHIKKIGHAGTLDPDVTGVLPIAIGQATKLIELMHEENKKYVGQGIFGFATDSYDISGKKTEFKKITSKIKYHQIQKAMQEFVGSIEQVPPIYSAVRVNGKHLYEYARAGIKVERPKRRVEVFSYDLTNEPVFDKENGQEVFDFKIECSKGTYVRSLINDLGTNLGVPAVMKNLRRTSSSGFDIDQAVKLNEISENPDMVNELLQPIDSFFTNYAHEDIDTDLWAKVKNGATISLKTNAKKVALGYNNRVKAIYQKDGTMYRPYLMLLQNE
ncbi:MAG: tRNA pseudouridine(55) synthase TruB [Lactobacillus sp.]|uniref:tRNA pseudouridine synthase B n=1 Tax=Lactobacillus kullabergensis TaxID=1218493 RepID=A0ABN5LCY9_9LACO|nr:tRNA pseudouridine(55) synthase TruB [Lactobacillus kullabergensis]AWM75454.1 tRNA pseudouridine(55) synthase TruB [Lactobacillus kullabergensis]MCT6889719.1 tRNA pseudouridine(55) synthase TruB [Lactobacillus sp.]